MSTKRELDAARIGVVNAAIAWAEEMEVGDLDPLAAQLYRRVQDIKPLLVDLDGDAAANSTYTSIAAAKSLPRGGLRRRVLSTVFWAQRTFESGMTTDAIERRIDQPHTSVSSAVNYLVNHGLLEKAGVRQKTRQGRWAEVYRCTELAARLINEEAARAAMD